jgi:adenine-specific DNA-methyltransferase
MKHPFNPSRLQQQLSLLSESTLASFKSIDFYKDDFFLKRIESLRPPLSLLDLENCVNNNKIFTIDNRKYIGSKANLLNFIEQTILSVAGPTIGVFFDPFSGTGVVSNRMRKHSDKVIANDLLYSNYITNSVFLNSKRSDVSVSKLDSIIMHLSSLRPKRGYACRNYSGTYFTHQNAGKIDSIRGEIENLHRKKYITTQEKNYLICSLIYAVDKVANTVGQYDAFLKHIGADSYEDGRHKIDSNVYREMELKRPFVIFDGKNQVYNADANAIAADVTCDVAYLDPPYNNRQYIDNYHVLENIASWQKPVLYGITRKFARESRKSHYSRKVKAANALSMLIKSLRCRHIFLSYNNEGIIDDRTILDILQMRGKVQLFRTDYSIFGNGAGVSRKRVITERLFHCRVK